MEIIKSWMGDAGRVIRRFATFRIPAEGSENATHTFAFSCHSINSLCKFDQANILKLLKPRQPSNSVCYFSQN